MVCEMSEKTILKRDTEKMLPKRQKARSGVSYSHLNKHCLINLLEGYIDETGLWHRNTDWLTPKISPKLPESDVIFTLPHELNPLWLANVAVMTTLLLAQNQHSCHQPQTEPPWL